MEEQKQRPVSGDEIDITQFFRWIGRGFSKLGTSIIAGMAGLRRQFLENKLFFVAIIVVGLISGALYTELVRKEYYRSSMVLRCDYLNTQSLRNAIDKFNLLSSERDTEGLQAAFGIDAATASNVQRFDFRPLYLEEDVVQMEVLREQLNNLTTEKEELVDKVIDRLKVENKDSYEIIVFVYDPDIVQSLEKAIVDYFRNSPYIRTRIESNREMLVRRKAKLESELRKLDSLKLAMFQNYSFVAQKSSGSNNVVVGGEEGWADPVRIFEIDLSLYADLEDVRKKLEILPDFEVVDGFTSFKKSETAALADVLAASVLFSIVVGYLILGAYRFDRMLANYPTKKHGASKT